MSSSNVVVDKGYAIRKKGTNEYIPVAVGRMGRGGSFVEPIEPEIGGYRNKVRVFNTERGARNFLSQWLRGKHHPEFEYEDGYRMDAGTRIQHVPTRIREEMEIVEIHFVVQ